MIYSITQRREGAKVIGQIMMLISVICLLLTVMSCPVITQEQTRIPKGMGRVTLNLNGVSSRTILPDADALKLADFVRYELTFGAVSGFGGVSDDFTRTSFEFGYTFAPIDLVPGTYGLTVEAYNSDDELAARGQVGEIDVTAGSNVVDVTLRAVLDSGAGKFEWAITLPTPSITLSSATMTIFNSINSQVDPVVDLRNPDNLSNTWNDDLPSGVYTVRFNLTGVDTSDNSRPVAVVWNELMHVYSTLTSKFEHAFTSDHFYNTHWNVTFDLNNPDYGGDPITGTQSVVHGNFATNPDPDWPGYALAGWYEAADGTGTPWSFDRRVHNDMTLYAQWRRIEGTVTVTLDVEEIHDAVFTITPNPIEITLNGAEQTVTLTGMTINGIAVTLANYTFTWEIAGKGIYADQPVTPPPGTSITLNDDFRHPYSTIGTHTIVLKAEEKDADGNLTGKIYQQNILFTITN